MTPELPKLPDTEQLFDRFPCGLIVTSHTGIILKINRTLCDWLRQSPDTLVGQRKFSELLTMGGRIFHQTHWVPMLDLQGSVSEVKLELKDSDGRKIPVLVNASRRRGPDGDVDDIAIIVADDRNKYERELLAARKRADDYAEKQREAQDALAVTQARLGQAMTGGALFVWGVDGATGRRFYGDEVAGLLGHDSPRHVDEAAMLASMAPDERGAKAQMLAEALKSSGAPYNWKYKLVGVDGKHRVAAASGQPFFNEDGSFAQFVGVLQDITASESLRAAAEDRALFAEQMVGIVSHDLRNPLSAILIGTKLLSGDIPVPENSKAKLLVNISNSAERAQRLISELLDFTAARLGSGLALTRQPIQLHEFVDIIIEELLLAFPGKSIVHGKEGEGSCSAAPDRLAQLIGNLVGNAFAYGTEDAPVTILTRLDSALATISVHNLGPAIPVEHRDSLFEPMVRGMAVDNNVRSVGLGLFIVKAIAQAHGGTVTVSSSDEAGTEFRFSFPRN